MNVNAELHGTHIRITFPYDNKLVNKMHSVPDSKWNKAHKYWYCPASPWHAELLFRLFPGLIADKYVTHLARCMPYFRVVSKATQPRPSAIVSKLYPYQEVAVEFIEACNGRTLLSDSMGTGKTVQALEWARRKGKMVRTILVVCGATLKDKWSKEIKTWYNSNCQPSIVDSNYIPQSDILIMTYDRMRILGKQLEAMNFDLFILDECQAIKNPKSKRGRVARRIADNCKYVLGLTATPNPNRPMELWHQLNTLRPWEYPSSWTFGSLYAGGIYNASNFKGTSNTAQLKDRLSSIMIRRRKKEVLDQLPDLTRSVMWVDLPDDDRAFYYSLELEIKAALRTLNPAHKGYYANALDKITALRQGVGIAKSKLAVDFINDFIDGEENTKLVVFCYYYNTIYKITSLLDNGTYSMLSAKQTPTERTDIIAKFRDHGGPRVLTMTSVGAEGIDLFGINTTDISNILLVDRLWSGDNEEQVEGRLHRVGQHFPVTAHYLNAVNTVDRHMTHIIEHKRSGNPVDRGEIVRELVRRILNDEEVQ